MARIGINTGSAANDNTGSTLRAAGGIINDNFSEIYTRFGDGTNLTSIGGTWTSTSVGIHTLKNVGIGTTNPTSALTVTGNGTFTGVVTATTFIGALTGTASTATLATNAQGLTGTPNITVGVVTASRLNVGTSGTIITTTASGLVGIGTTNPRFTLEVGAVGASGTTLFVNGDARVTGIVTIGPASITLNGITNIINVGTGITINGSTGIISATAIVLGGTTLTGVAVTSITAGSGISVNQGTGNVTITATGGGGSSQWVTTAAGIHTLSNVGIGTTNPTSALTVTGNGTFTGVVTATTFVGALTGTASTATLATNAQGLTGTPNITVGVATATTFNSNADVTIYGIRVGRGEGANAFNTVVGNEALNNSNSGNYNTAYGYRSLYSNTTGYQNTANGGNALRDNNTGTNNTASGISALLSNTGGELNTANGAFSLAYNITGSQNTATGHNALNSATGSNNTGIGVSAGKSITTGSKNTLLGSYNGNQNGLDIRTSDGNVVLSDGDGNIRFYANSSGNVGLGTTNPTSALTVKGNTSLETLNVSGVSTFSGNINVSEKNILFGLSAGSSDDRIVWGASSAEIYTNTTNLFLKTNLTSLNLQGEIISLSNYAGDEVLINASNGGSVDLYYNNSKKLETTGTGITITGTTVTNQLSVSGISTLGTVQISSGIVTATSGIVTYYGDASYTASGRWTLGASGNNDYTFTGIGFTQTTNDPVLYLARGRVYEFVNNSGGSHPFQIRVSNGGSAYSDGVTNNGGASGVIRFEIPFSAPNTLYYQCTNHSGMGNTISVYPSTL